MVRADVKIERIIHPLSRIIVHGHIRDTSHQSTFRIVFLTENHGKLAIGKILARNHEGREEMLLEGKP